MTELFMPSFTRREGGSVHVIVTNMNDPGPRPAPLPTLAPIRGDDVSPYVAVIFTNVRARVVGPDGSSAPVDDEGYGAMAERMDSLARDQPGYIGIESVRGADGFGITVSYWETEAHAAAWKQVTEHLGAQLLGRERWYERYVTRVATVTRSYAWQRDRG